MVTETLTLYRGDADKYGNPNKQDHGTVQGVFAWGTTQPTTPTGGRGEGASTGAELYVPKGTDLRARDRVKRASGDTYRVVGGVQWDRAHPTGGRDFGWVAYQLVSM